MEKVALRNCLDAQNVVRVEDCLEVLLLKEGFGKLIDVVIVWVFLLEVFLAQRLQHLQNCCFRVFGALVEKISHQFLQIVKFSSLTLKS